MFSMPRYPGGLFVDSVVDWVATSVVGLPRILYYSKETLVSLMISSITLFILCRCVLSKYLKFEAN